MQPDDDEAWRSIVDNYGDRVELDPDDPRLRDERAQGAEGRPWDWQEPGRGLLDGVDGSEGPGGSHGTDGTDPGERFVPPAAPPVPLATRDRLVAWCGLFGAPAALLVFLIAGVTLPDWAALLLVAAFVGGFVYLVVRMPREPRDPDDDGAVL